MAKIFISYRRDDSQYQADRLHTALKPHVADPQNDIFIDVDNIPFGVDFVEYLDNKVGQCEVLFVLIGNNWLETRDPETGQRRLDNPDDFVRIEIKSALDRKIPVVPVTFDEATVPKAADLPDDLQPLARRNGAPVRRLSFDADVARIVRGLPVAFDTREAPSSSARDGSGAREKPETSEERAAEAARAGRVVAERLFPVELPGVAKWPVPQMVAIPPGRFLMGAADGEKGSGDDERPRHEVTIDYPFALGQHAVTFAEWDAALAAGAKLAKPGDQGWGRGDRPVINVSWEYAQAYLGWLNEKLGLAGRGDAYRLPSEAEWEYACRAGTETLFSFGQTITPEQANYDGNITYGSGPKGTYHQKTRPVGSYPANGFGLHDMHGNVWEWCADAWHDTYAGAPDDGSVWEGGDPSRRVLRGGSWSNNPQVLRSASRSRYQTAIRIDIVGIRVARTLEDMAPS